MLLSSIIVNMAILPFAAMALLTRRDAILPEDRERYDRAMSSVAQNQSFKFYRVRDSIRLDIHENPTGELIRREFFRPSADARAYFNQKQEQADKLLQEYCEQQYCRRKNKVEEE